MCLCSQNNLTIEVLEKDTAVYKVLEQGNNTYYSPYYSMSWNIGKSNYVYFTTILESLFYFNDSVFRIKKGLHALTDIERARTYMKEVSENSISKTEPSISKLVIAKMKIPKGAIIIRGDNNEIVTTQMKLIEIL